MVWISIGIELIIIGLVLSGYFKEKEKGHFIWNQKSSLLRIAGKQIVSILPYSGRRQEKNQMYQVVCKLEGEKGGEEAFLEYRQKRWGLILGVLLLINTIWLLQYIQPVEEKKVIASRQDRPEYGQGDRTQQVMVILEGEEKAEGTLSLEIPEKSIPRQQAKQRVKDGLRYIKENLDGQTICGDIKLPAEWNEVAFFYESLSPQLLTSSGKWLGEIREKSYCIKMNVTAMMGEEIQVETLTFFTAVLGDLNAKERLALIMEDVEEGQYLTANELILPDTAQTGEKLTWIEDEKSGKEIVVLIGVMFLFLVLWHQDQEYKQKLKKREQQTRQSYPEFMNELVILVGAGLSLTAAWYRIGQDYQKKRKVGGDVNPLYEEIYRESCEMEAGVSMREILEEFAGRVRFKEARRFAVLLTQNLRRGDAFLVSRLKELNQEAWELRKKQVREKTEEADTKLLLPLMLMLVVILIIVLSPAIISMQV